MDGAVCGTQRQCWFYRNLHSSFDSFLMIYDAALRRYHQDKLEKLPRGQGGFRHGVIGTDPASTIVGNAIIARNYNWSPDTFMVKAQQSHKLEFTNPTTYKQYLTVYKHVQRKSFYSNATYQPLHVQYLGPKQSDGVRYNFLGSQKKAVYTYTGITTSLAYGARAAATYDYTLHLHTAAAPAALKTILNIGAYLVFHGYDPSWNANAQGLSLPHPMNFYNTNSLMVADEADAGAYPQPSFGTVDAWSVYPAFGVSTTSSAGAISSYASGAYNPGIAQTMFGNNVDWSGSGGFCARPYQDMAGTHAAHTVDSIGASYAPIGTSTSFTTSNMGTFPGSRTYETSNEVNNILSYDSKHWESGWGGTNSNGNSDQAPTVFSATTGGSSAGQDQTDNFYRHLNYNHMKNVTLRRLAQIRGSVKVTINPGERVTMTIRAPTKTFSAALGHYGIYNLSRLIPNKMNYAQSGEAALVGKFPSYDAAITTIAGDFLLSAADLKGTTVALISVVGQKAIDTDLNGEATMGANLALSQTYRAAYKYCIKRSPHALHPQSSRHAYWRNDDGSVLSTVANSAYRIPPAPSQFVVTGTQPMETAGIAPDITTN